MTAGPDYHPKHKIFKEVLLQKDVFLERDSMNTAEPDTVIREKLQIANAQQINI